MEISSTAPKVVLFKGVLCDREHNKLKKLQVKLKKWISSTGKTVFNIDIQGIGHKFHLQLDFTEQELCFIRLEELQVRQENVSCFQCLQRSNFAGSYYTRIVLLFYRENEDSDGESKCVKVPLIQSGNIYAATTLRKLQKVFYNHVVSEDEITHWLVGVITCGHLSTQDHVFLCVTKYAIVIVSCEHYHIMNCHPFYCCEIGITCGEDENSINIEIVDKPRNDHYNENDNFIFARQYIFRTSHCRSIEKNIKSVLRKSTLHPQGPSLHWNIHHSELSATDIVIPGTTSDNVMIVPHRPHEFDNNNTGSSGSASQMESYKISNLTTQNPAPHKSINGHMFASTSGTLPSDLSTEVQFSGSCIGQNFSSSGIDPMSFSSGSSLPTDVSLEFQSSSDLPKGHGSSSRTDTSGSHSSKSPSAHHYPPQTLEGTDPTGKSGTLGRIQKQKMAESPTKTPGGFFFIDSAPPVNDETYWSFIDEAGEDELPPPPAPCSAQLKPHVDVEFKYKPPAPHNINKPSEDSLSYDTVTDGGQSNLMRSLSYVDLNETSMHSHMNTQYMQSARRNVHDDNLYYHFYYNYGYVDMREKLRRRKLLSCEMKDVDFNKLENHEEWYDIGFKERTKDLRFCRINGMNIKVDEDKSINEGYSRAQPVQQADDPYWSGELAITIQNILQAESGKGAFFHETRRCFDLTSEQLINIQVLLSLVSSNNNWKNLAEFIGLTISDISIIEHFCFTYRELTASIVLIHWMRLNKRGKLNVRSDYDTLRQILERLERDDIMNVLVNNKMDLKENEMVTEVTHF